MIMAQPTQTTCFVKQITQTGDAAGRMMMER
jgi:hypothetical protein